MGGIKFYCQNVNIFLPPAVGNTLELEELSNGQIGDLKMTCPQVVYPTVPEISLPQNPQPGYPSHPNPTYPQMIKPIEPGGAYPIYPGEALPEISQPPAISGSFSEQLEEGIFNLVNTERASQGLPALRPNDALSDVARRKSLNMGDLGYFSHTAPDGTTTADWLRSEGHAFSRWGENIANFGVNATAKEIMNGWMNSPGHRANILDHNFTLLGVGVYQINTRIFATQVFGS